MIPSDYVCSKCKITGVKLWRQYQTCADQIELLCGPCAEKDQDRTINLAETDQCGWLVAAVPTLTGTFWGYTSVPPEGVAWWQALPFKLSGQWKEKGGTVQWMPYGVGMDMVLAKKATLLRIDGGAVCVLVPDAK